MSPNGQTGMCKIPWFNMLADLVLYYCFHSAKPRSTLGIFICCSPYTTFKRASGGLSYSHKVKASTCYHVIEVSVTPAIIKAVEAVATSDGISSHWRKPSINGNLLYDSSMPTEVGTLSDHNDKEVNLSDEEDDNESIPEVVPHQDDLDSEEMKMKMKLITTTFMMMMFQTTESSIQ